MIINYQFLVEWGKVRSIAVGLRSANALPFTSWDTGPLRGQRLQCPLLTSTYLGHLPPDHVFLKSFQLCPLRPDANPQWEIGSRGPPRMTLLYSELTVSPSLLFCLAINLLSKRSLLSSRFSIWMMVWSVEELGSGIIVWSYSLFVQESYLKLG